MKLTNELLVIENWIAGRVSDPGAVQDNLQR